MPLVTPSTIAAQYLCQVPQLKSATSLIISILVADLVFLQALWKIFNLAVSFWLERKQPEAKYCLGCEKRLSHGDCEKVDAGSPTPIRDKSSTELNVKVTSSEFRAEPDTQRSVTETAVQMAAPGVDETEAFDLNHDIAPI